MVNIERKNDNIIVYERKLKKMEGNQGEETTPSNARSGVKAEKVLTYLGIVGGIISLIGIIFSINQYVIVPISLHSHEIEEIEEDMKDMEDNLGDGISDIRESLDELTKYVYSNGKLVGSGEANAESYAAPVKFSPEYTPEVTSENGECKIMLPNWGDETENIASDFNDDNKLYGPDELRNKPFITKYTDKGNEVYFCGQYNENNHWDGKCILNIYRNNELITIFVAIYKDGDLFSYERASCENGDKWTIANRIAEKDANGKEYTRGETSVFAKTQSLLKETDSERLDVSQIVTVEDFKEKAEKGPIKQYYSGNTSDGYYNDNSGKAYLVNYDENGNVAYLYVGKIKKGLPEDTTGAAWSISLGEDGYYYHYEGVYIDGDHDTPEKWEPMSQEKINNTVDPRKFNCPLLGLVGEDL